MSHNSVYKSSCFFYVLRSPQKKLQSKYLLNSNSYHILKWRIPLHTDQRQEHPYNTTQPYRVHHFSDIPIAAAFSTSKCGKNTLNEIQIFAIN